MNEESQIDDMRAALRGDRERAEQARERSTENVRALIETPMGDAEPEPEPDPVSSRLGRFFRR